jgi:hypothetical protein
MMKVNKLLAAALVIQAGVIIGLWYGPAAQPARAEIPDAGAQTVQIIQLLSSTNDKLDRIIGVLQSGDLKATVVKPDDK